MGIISGGNVMTGDGLHSPPFEKASDPVANDFAGSCVVGSLAVNTAAGRLFICTATNGSTTSAWALVGSQV